MSGAADSGALPTPCIRPDDCKAAGVEGVCRGSFCRADVPCEDDVECGLGEACEGSVCRFVGCIRNSDCATGQCNFVTFTCAECSNNAECPADKPVCNPAGACVGCVNDDQCQPPGPGYCETSSGSCVHCNIDAHCPPGLYCQSGTCIGAGENEPCANGVECAEGLICVSVGNNSTVCRASCNLYTPTCPAGQLCLKLTFSGSPSLVFEAGAPLGVCSAPFSGLKFYGESCSATQVCQPNLQCVQDSPTTSSCKAFCDPVAPQCQPDELCHPYPGDFSGREYGLCYEDTGVGEACEKEADCRSGLTCSPRPDPSTFNDVSTECRFGAPDAGVGLSACTADAQCKSGFCANDTAVGATRTFCYTACETDADCSVGEKTGYCDNNSNITIQPYPATTIQGCRPACDNNLACAAYNASFVCRLTTQSTGPAATRARRTCATALGTLPVGEECSLNGDCASGYCWKRDARGQPRPGICTAACVDVADCTGSLTDGGTPDLICQPTVLNHSAGSDALINTADDRDAVATVCAPPACTADEECPATFPRCTVDANPAGTATGLVLRCRGDALGTRLGGASCSDDSECLSGACAELVPPSTGTGSVCLQPCAVATTACASGLVCRVDAARMLAKDGTAQLFTACVP